MKHTLAFIAILTMGIALISVEARAGVSDTASEKMVKICALEDGVSIAVHYNPSELKLYHNDVDKYTAAVLGYAIEAYTEIVYRYGFDTPGFTFVNPDKTYHYDHDKIIDIYIAAGGEEKTGLAAFSGKDFLDAPCYDVIKGKAGSYDAIILFPADYKRYLTGSNRVDISDAELLQKMRGTLFHEMLHIIVYSYNKNIAPWYSRSKDASHYHGGDWYVEGLARYFETRAGSYDNFFSKGFRKKEHGKTITSQEGANYLMENPSGSLRGARYDYSLFWAYIHKNYSMGAIEEISRRFRFISKDGMKEEMPAIISAVLKEDFNNIFMEFGVAMYFKYFNPDIKNGLSDLKVVSQAAFFDKRDKKVASWASNFVTVNLHKKGMPEVIALKKIREDGELKMSVFANFENGKIAQINKVTLDKPELLCKINLIDMKRSGVKELILIITNAGHTSNMKYRILQY